MTIDTPLFLNAADLEYKVRSRDHDNSWSAARITRPAQQSVKARIISILADGPLTDDDVFDLYVIGGGERTAQRVRTARKELVRDGLVRSTTNGTSRYGNDSQKWELA